MKVIEFPPSEQWASLVLRPAAQFGQDVRSTVSQILHDVKVDGDAALRKYTAQFDGAHLDTFKVTTAYAKESIDEALALAINSAFANINSFHGRQTMTTERIETQPGVVCWRESRPIDPVGLYIPGGTAPLFSSLLMLAVPARIAGCREIVVCTPPGPDGSVSPVILYTASLMGIPHVYRTGGAQAIAAMAYGTKSIPAVHKIFGPGNAYVTAAKQLIQEDGVAIDMPAGPSEVLIIADESADPSFVAADLLSQAEHDKDSQVVLVSDSSTLIEAVLTQLTRQLADLPRREIATASLNNSFALLVKNLNTAIDFSNAYAPEHLIINTRQSEQLSRGIQSAGSVFLGPWSCESLGDYASGTNHTLPTSGFARNFSGVSVDSFVKKITFQHISQNGLHQLGPAVETLARAEGLTAHERAVSIRLKAK